MACPENGIRAFPSGNYVFNLVVHSDIKTRNERKCACQSFVAFLFFFIYSRQEKISNFEVMHC